MKTKDKLLENYYNGESSLEEEMLLKNWVLEEEFLSIEKDAFEWYRIEGSVPEGLEEIIFDGIKKKEASHYLRSMVLRIGSIAATLLLIVTIYLGIQADRSRKVESEFFVMEQALYQISESLQPYDQDDMLVLWVDDNVEIIIE